MKARLPKLTLSAFRTTLLDSQRFWSQFSNKTDQKTMLSVSKLSYLCKLVDTTVHPLIKGYFLQLRRMPEQKLLSQQNLDVLVKWQMHIFKQSYRQLLLICKTENLPYQILKRCMIFMKNI